MQYLGKDIISVRGCMWLYIHIYICIHMSSVFFGDTLVHNAEQLRLFPSWGFTVLYHEYNHTGFNHRKRNHIPEAGSSSSELATLVGLVCSKRVLSQARPVPKRAFNMCFLSAGI